MRAKVLYALLFVKMAKKRKDDAMDYDCVLAEMNDLKISDDLVRRPTSSIQLPEIFDCEVDWWNHSYFRNQSVRVGRAHRTSRGFLVYCYCGARMVTKTMLCSPSYSKCALPSCPSCCSDKIVEKHFFLCFECDSAHGANRSKFGIYHPFGVPASPELLVLRHYCHFVFDQLWKGNSTPGIRRKAYTFLASIMGYSEARAHFGKFGGEDCRKFLDYFYMNSTELQKKILRYGLNQTISYRQ